MTPIQYSLLIIVLRAFDFESIVVEKLPNLEENYTLINSAIVSTTCDEGRLEYSAKEILKNNYDVAMGATLSATSDKAHFQHFVRL